jgi:hypothetical protein
MKKILLSAILFLAVATIMAQDPTVVTQTTNCSVFRNFNTSDEGFSAPSIYSDASDVSFFWNAAAGAEIESSGLIVRTASLISPVFVQSEAGVAKIGFRYSVPNGTSYRIRVISTVNSTPLEILATTANGPVFTAFTGTDGDICLTLTDADIAVGRQIRFEFTFSMTQPGNIVFDNLSLLVAAGPLPVTFEGFVARENKDGSVKLLWNVGDEINVKGYYVEGSTNGIDFVNSGYLKAEGKSVYSLDYTGKISQVMFFKIKNIDFDGKNSYTPIIKIYGNEQAKKSIQIYPSPASDLVTIQHSKASANTLITLYSPVGKLLQQVKVAPFTYQTQLNVNKLAKGIYVVKFNDEQAPTQSILLIKN